MINKLAIAVQVHPMGFSINQCLHETQIIETHVGLFIKSDPFLFQQTKYKPPAYSQGEKYITMKNLFLYPLYFFLFL